MQRGTEQPWFVRGDLDGFFGLFIDNLLQLMLIMVLCQYVCGFPLELITGKILPGAAASILLGNLFYTWQARRLARETGRRDITALPFGINTVSLLAFIFLVMAPVYYETGDPDFAWKMGLAACFLSGVVETLGAFLGDWFKKHTPRPALLSSLAGVALAFIVLGFTFRIFSSPLIAIIPMMLILISYGAHIRLPLRLPAGLVVILVGTAAAWILRHFGISHFDVPQEPLNLGFNIPVPVIGDVLSALTTPTGWSYIAVIIPIGLFSVIGSIQNLESADAAGDRFETRPSLLANGLTSLLAGTLGSPFPTTIYIGHPGWKAMGARTGYSALNGAVIMLLCLTGGVHAVLKIVPIEVTLGILIWIGIVMVAQAFQKTEGRYALAVVMGLIPSLAAWALHLIETTLRNVEGNLFQTFEQLGSDLYIHGIITLYQGFLITAMIFASVMTYIIDRKFLKAAAWCLAASLLSFIGLIHAYELTPVGIENYFGWMAAPRFAVVYGVLALILLTLNNWSEKH